LLGILRLLGVGYASHTEFQTGSLLAPSKPDSLAIPDMLKLKIEPRADCDRYDNLREVSHAIH
jgi:hypothetical protein